MRLILIVIAGALLGTIAARLATPDAVVIPQLEGTKTEGRATRPHVIPPVVPQGDNSVRQRQLAPSDRRYSPVALLREMNGELEVTDIFAQEPRDSIFAPIMERRIKGILAVALQELEISDKVRSVSTECRTLSCYTKLEVDKSDAHYVYDLVNGIMLGDVHVPGIDESVPGFTYVTISTLNRPESRDDSYHERFLMEAMRPALDLAKQRRSEESHETRP